MEQAATVHGGEPNPLDSTGLCLLSLDGGGVRGLSTLYILKGLMDRLNQKRPNGTPKKKPCEVFDLIGGTSTGGLIAIMLGRLEMDVDECIAAYIQLMKKIFEKPSKWNLAASLFGNIEPRFDASKLEDAINQVISRCGANPTDLFNNQAERGCRVFVCSITQETKEIVRLRSYPEPGKLDIPATICQAARATSAATTFFEPVSIGARRFADGALGANNPVDEVEGEASDIWCPETGDLKPLVKCFVSIGTGNPGKKAMEDNLLKFMSKTLPELTTQTEQTEKRFIAKWRQHYDGKRYFRFNVEQGLQEVGLAEYQEQGLIEAATEGYLDHQAVVFQVRNCIRNLESKQNGTDTQFAIVIQEYQRKLMLLEQWRGRARWHVPFDRNPKFTGREKLLNDLERRLQQHNHTTKIAVIGLGGVGKTQLVLELAHRVREQCAVFWIPVNSLANLQTAYREIAEKLRLPGCKENSTQILELVQTYLSDESIGPWLLVLDNADDVDLWTSPVSPDSGSKCLVDFLPRSTQGSIIFTTRNRKVTNDLVQDIVEVPEMDKSEATHLLKTTVATKELVEPDYQMVPILLEKLTYLPLAIVQAASYIRKNRVSFSAYNALLMDLEDEVMDLLGEEYRDDGRYRDISNAVAKTWIISFQQICRDDPLAAEYLSLMACVDPRDIPHAILVEGPLRRKETNAIGTLDAHSFIKKHSDSTTFDMHRLVHLATRGWLKGQERLSDWQSKAVTRLGKLLANTDQTNRTQWRVYIPHAQFAVADHTKGDNEIINLVQRCGACLDYDGRYGEAETMYWKALKYKEKVVGPEHPNTLASVNNLGSVLERQGRYEEAEAMHRRALEGYKKVLGPEHPSTLTSVSNLSSVLSRQGKYEEAEATHRRALEGSEKVLGPEHPDTLTSVNNLGSVLSSQGKYEEAKAMHRRGLEGYEKVLGPEHPSTLTSVNNLGLILSSQGNNLGSVLSSQGKYEEAEGTHRRGLEGYERVLGPEHPSTLTSVNNLGLVLSRQGKYEEAEALHRRALEGYKKVLGPEHPDTLTSGSNLRSLLEQKGQPL
ncbi:hypothetical protein MW887_009938 [Aspergillus wentii]|nr:hypothetical protein MW887_009938 [Aspergillus wentii]